MTHDELKAAGEAISAKLPDNTAMLGIEADLRAYAELAREAAYAEAELASLVVLTEQLVASMTENDRRLASWRDAIVQLPADPPVVMGEP